MFAGLCSIMGRHENKANTSMYEKCAWELFCGRKATSGKSEEHDYRVALLANLILAHAQ